MKEDSTLTTHDTTIVADVTLRVQSKRKLRPPTQLTTSSREPSKRYVPPTNLATICFVVGSAPYSRRNYKKISYSEDCFEDDSEDDNCDPDDKPLCEYLIFNLKN